MEVFNNLFSGKIRLWNKSQIVLLHIFSLFTPVNKIYKVNKNIKECFNYFFNGISSIELATSISTRTYFSKENPLTV